MYIQPYQTSTALSSLDVNFFKLNYHFSIFFNELFNHKNIILTHYKLNKDTNKFYIVLNLYFREKKLINFRKLKLKKNSKQKNLYVKSKFIQFLTKDFEKKFNINLVLFDVKILNKLVIFSFFFKHLKKKTRFFKKSLFERRSGLYLDILKLIILYNSNQIKLEFFTKLIGELFKRLSKKKHGNFLKFIKNLFKIAFLNNKNLFFNTFKGCKFLLSGKFRGKLRAKKISFVFGSIPISTISKSIDSAKIDVYTIYGAFGIKLYVYKDLTVKKNFLRTIKRFFIIKKLIKYLKKKTRKSKYILQKLNRKCKLLGKKTLFSRYQKTKKNKYRKWKKKGKNNFFKKKTTFSILDQVRAGTFSITKHFSRLKKK